MDALGERRLDELVDIAIEHGRRIGTLHPGAQILHVQRELAEAGPDPLNQAGLHGLLGVAYALLGEAARAITEGEKAITLKSAYEDPYESPKVEETVAQIYAALGDADHAVPILKRLLQIPYRAPITTGRLRIDPFWDPIRNDPGFQQLLTVNEHVGP